MPALLGVSSLLHSSQNLVRPRTFAKADGKMRPSVTTGIEMPECRVLSEINPRRRTLGAAVASALLATFARASPRVLKLSGNPGKRHRPQDRCLHGRARQAAHRRRPEIKFSPTVARQRCSDGQRGAGRHDRDGLDRQPLLRRHRAQAQRARPAVSVRDRAHVAKSWTVVGDAPQRAGPESKLRCHPGNRWRNITNKRRQSGRRTT